MTHMTITCEREHSAKVVDAIKSFGITDIEQTIGRDVTIEFDTDNPGAVTTLHLFTFIGARIRVT